MLLTKTIKIKWNNKTRRYYEGKGYIFTRYGNDFEVNTTDLTNGSNAFVNIKCDCEDCKNPYLKPMAWGNYLNYVHEDGKYYCRICGVKLIGLEKHMNTILNKSISFEQWCYDNLDIDYANEILSRWDSQLNKKRPSEVTWGSEGNGRKGYWFKCPLGIHPSELKNICNFTRGKISSLDCNYCNSFAQYLINLYGKNALNEYWDYEKNDKLNINPWDISYCSSKDKVFIICQKKDYHESYPTTCANFTNMNSRCPFCHGLKVHPLDSLGKVLEDKGLLALWSKKNKKSPYKYMPNANEKAWWVCPTGKHEDYFRLINNSNTFEFRCPECGYSKGEKIIEEYLINNGFVKEEDYIPQKTYKGLLGVGNGLLSYDFYLCKFNLLIEYQGLQHEKYVKGFHKDMKAFKTQVEHDRRKKKYAIDNKIKLLEIWYYDFDNIEKILNRELKSNNTNQQKAV